MIVYFLYCFVGCFLGVVTGLIPGVHVNLVCLLGLSLYPFLGVDTISFAVLMVSVSLTHTFLDFIPAIFLGVPEEETALSILPTHRMYLEGRSLDAVKLTGYGSLLGLFFSLLFIVPALYIIPLLHGLLRQVIVWVMFFALGALILREKRWGKAKALLIVVLSGALGLSSFKLKVLSSSQVLFPLFSGMFGLATIIYSLYTRPTQTNVPQQSFSHVEVDLGVVGSGFLGSIGGMLVGVLPAFSPSQVGILMARLYGSSVARFLVAVSAINTADAIYSFVALYTLGNPRSGVATMLSKVLTMDALLFALFVGVFAFCGLWAYLLHLYVGRVSASFFSKINYRLISILVVGFVSSLVFVFTGFFGILVLFFATVLGLMPPLGGVSRTHLMGVLIIPTMFFFLGL
ncbi:MAG: hypothetical protein GF334_10660 [Candidatus Altiarchaeales archaeon]|nr:hypothetical protein [Candidatus Altiarchaeales archaeon]